MAQSMYTYDDLGSNQGEARGLSVKFLKSSGLVEIAFEARDCGDSVYFRMYYDQDQDGVADDDIHARYFNFGNAGYPVGYSDLVPVASHIHTTPAITDVTTRLSAGHEWRRYKIYWFPFATAELEANGGEPLEERTVKIRIYITDGGGVITDKTMDLDIDLRPALTNTTRPFGPDTYIKFEEPTVKKVVRARPKIYTNTSPSRSTATQLNAGDYASSAWGLDRSLDGGATFATFGVTGESETSGDRNVWLKKGVKIGDYPPNETDADLRMANLEFFYFEDQVFREDTQQTSDTFYWIELNTKIAEETY